MSEYMVAIADAQFVSLFKQRGLSRVERNLSMLENKEDQRETKSWVKVSPFSRSTQVRGLTYLSVVIVH